MTPKLSYQNSTYRTLHKPTLLLVIPDPKFYVSDGWTLKLKAGAEGTPFQGGLYHGRILLDQDYPMKPPRYIGRTTQGSGLRAQHSGLNTQGSGLRPSGSGFKTMIGLLSTQGDLFD